MHSGNKDLKEYFKQKRIFQWEVAKLLGYSESEFARRLRTEFPDDIKNQLKTCIDEYIQGNEPDVSFYNKYIKSLSKERYAISAKRRQSDENQRLDRYADKILDDITYHNERNQNYY